LGDLFSSADKIMKWLGDMASLISSQGQVMSWISPLGLPVMQPYRKKKNYEIKTMLQSITLVSQDENLPVCNRKQKTAFPPNFVHSLDASHMLLTTLQMKDQGLCFAAVHDSYWTFPSDVPIMSAALRKSFVELYEQPVLESVLESCQKRYPSVNFPPIPKRGKLNIDEVLNSRYFFH
jgi:DNA-directed RNA polymerase